MNITVSAYNRPRYLERTLSALSRCDGIGDCRVAVMLDPCWLTDEQAQIAAKYGFEAYRFTERAGCNGAIMASIQHGFDSMGSDYHVHIEDDCVPTRDALRWFAAMGEAYRDDPRVMNVSGYQRVSNGNLGEAGLRRWFTPWGWGVWRDRWLGLAAGWSTVDSISWDVVVNHVLRAGRYEIYPTVSRIQNIGGEDGTHVPSPEWHAENHHVPETADDIEGEPQASWTIVSVREGADHA